MISIQALFETHLTVADLQLIAMLDTPPRPDLGTVPWSEWRRETSSTDSSSAANHGGDV